MRFILSDYTGFTKLVNDLSAKVNTQIRANSKTGQISAVSTRLIQGRTVAIEVYGFSNKSVVKIPEEIEFPGLICGYKAHGEITDRIVSLLVSSEARRSLFEKGEFTVIDFMVEVGMFKITLDIAIKTDFVLKPQEASNGFLSQSHQNKSNVASNSPQHC